jgi:aerobic-type carbon monoxide dehydrogenase small subunit (CoxS/CutS family)
MDGPLVPLTTAPREKLRLALTINGEPRDVVVESYKTLLEVLREDLGLTGTKHGCELGECGACAVILDGELVLSCLVAAVECQDRAAVTVEGLRDGPRLHALQEAFADHGAAQCGYCTPGMLLAAKCLLDATPDPSRDQIAEALSGQICRCTGYLQIFDAVAAAGAMMRGERAPAPLLAAVQRGDHGED